MVSARNAETPDAPALSYIARQAIYQNERRVWGYQVHHRSAEPGQEGARRTLVAVGLDLGLSRVGGRHRILAEFSADALLARLPTVLSPSQLVIDVAATTAREPAVREVLRRYAAHGYTLSFKVSEPPSEGDAAIPSGSLIRCDANQLWETPLSDYATALARRGHTVLATHVADAEDLAHVRALGCTLFQGLHLRQPEMLSGLRVAPERAAALSLLAKVQSPDTSFADLSALIHRDPVLSYQILRFVGSAAMARPVRVDSVQRGLLMLGLRAVRQWASLVLLTRAATHDEHAMLLAMTRARMAEQLAMAMSKNPSAGFTVGLFSALEHLLGQPLAELLEALPLESDVSRALLGGEGYLGDILQAIMSYEDGVVTGSELGLTSAHVASAYIEAVEWAEEARHTLSAASGPA